MTSMDKLTEDNRKRIMKLVGYRTEEVAYRDKLNLQKSADRAYSKVFAKDRDLYNLYRRVFNVPIGMVSLTD